MPIETKITELKKTLCREITSSFGERDGFVDDNTYQGEYILGLESIDNVDENVFINNQSAGKLYLKHNSNESEKDLASPQKKKRKCYGNFLIKGNEGIDLSQINDHNSEIEHEANADALKELDIIHEAVHYQRTDILLQEYETPCPDIIQTTTKPTQLEETLAEKSKRLIDILEQDQFNTKIEASNDDPKSIEKYFMNSALVELSRLSWTSHVKQNYLRGCLWSPDGTCLLAAVNLEGMHVVNMPIDLYYNSYISKTRPVDCLSSAVSVKENGLVYDYTWFPHMSSNKPETCFWASSIQHAPVQLWDAFDGKIISSYRGYNAVDEVESALSLSFSPDGSSIYGGYKSDLKIFDTDKPGREYSSYKLQTPASSLAINSEGSVIAVGSWNKSITLLSKNCGDYAEISTLNGHKGGVTHLRFAPSGTVLFSGSRKDPLLQCWDLRMTAKPLHTLCRSADTNQRIYFDLSPSARWLISGGTKGTIRVWDTDTLNKEVYELNFPVHNDCCNGVSFHPCRPIIATSSGQHHFDDIDNNDCIIRENSLNFWWIGDVQDN